MSNYLDAILAETGLLHLWELGSDQLDSVGTAHGTAAGGPLTDKLGRFYGEPSTSFDGTDDTISVGRPADLVALTGAWSIEAVVNFPVSANYGFAIFSADGAPNSIPMSLSIGGNGAARRAEAGILVAPYSDPVQALRSQPGDLFKFVVTTAGTFTFTNTAASYDSYGGLYDSAGTMVTANDDSAGGGRWLMGPLSLAVGTYYVLHTAFSTGRGAYTILATPGTGVASATPGSGTAPAPLNNAPAEPLPPGVPTSGVLEGGGSSSWYFISSSSILPADTWVRIMATFDGTNLKVYVNGALEGTSGAVPAINPISPSGNFRIARRWDTTGFKPYFPGNAQHVAVYNRALSAGENTDHQDALDSDPVALLDLKPPPDDPLQRLAIEAILLAPSQTSVPGGGETDVRPLLGQTWPR